MENKPKAKKVKESFDPLSMPKKKMQSQLKQSFGNKTNKEQKPVENSNPLSTQNAPITQATAPQKEIKNENIQTKQVNDFFGTPNINNNTIKNNNISNMNNLNNNMSNKNTNENKEIIKDLKVSNKSTNENNDITKDLKVSEKVHENKELIKEAKPQTKSDPLSQNKELIKETKPQTKSDPLSQNKTISQINAEKERQLLLEIEQKKKINNFFGVQNKNNDTNNNNNYNNDDKKISDFFGVPNRNIDTKNINNNDNNNEIYNPKSTENKDIKIGFINNNNSNNSHPIKKIEDNLRMDEEECLKNNLVEDGKTEKRGLRKKSISSSNLNQIMIKQEENKNAQNYDQPPTVTVKKEVVIGGKVPKSNIDYESKIDQKKDDFYSDLLLIRKNCGIMDSETIRDVTKASYDSCDINQIGVLVLTDFRLVFKFYNEANEKILNIPEDYLKIPLFHISKLSRIQDVKMSYEAYPIELNLRDTRSIKFHIYDKNSNKFYNNLNDIITPSNPALLYQFTEAYRKYSENIEGKDFFNGWNIYDPLTEYKRQGITETNDLGLRFCYCNSDYSLCPTYPSLLVFPSEMSDFDLKMAASYRTKNRLPVMSYYFNGNRDKELEKASTNSDSGRISCPSIWRSSQNKAGLTGSKRNDMDEKLMKLMRKLCKKLYIFDARPKINALVNRLNGGGYENLNNYNDTNLKFCEIDNIHKARNCLNDLNKLCLSQKLIDNSKFWSSIEGTGWYTFIYLLLKFSTEISLTLQDNNTVLIHCSDGWDRSTQLITLSQMLVDPYFRTIKGLAILIEKEWLSFGHQFGLRNGIYWKQVNEDQRSPIFLQWLDCLHQLIFQFPNSFEYNNDLLLFLAKNYTANIYGTFMYNNEKERFEKNAKDLTTSVWTDVFKNLNRFKNVFYNPENPVRILRPNYAPYNLKFWGEYFLANNIYLDNNFFYISDLDKSIAFRTNRMFYEHVKTADVLKNMNLEVKEENLLDTMTEIYTKTKLHPELFDKLNDKTKKFLNDLENNFKFKEILIEKTKRNLIENNNNIIDSNNDDI